MTKKRLLADFNFFLHRTVNRWRFWPSGILPLPAQPASRQFAFDRGTPIDRYLMERFLERNAAVIRGRVLEIGEKGYTMQYGGSHVTKADVLHAVKGNPEATIVGDLVTGRGLKWDAYDCLLLTQTLHVIYDIHAAVKNIHRMLTPGGTALVTIPSLSQISRYDADRWGDYWRMTPGAVRRLFEEAFPAEGIELETHGNVRLATAFLYGLAAEEVPPDVLTEVDRDYPVLICVCARKLPTKGKRKK
jgi:SAM-dependent methyltransferase